MSSMKRLAPAVALLLAAVPAAATTSYPGVLRDELGLDASPSCTVCHASAGGGPGTATKPMAEALVAAGLVPFDDDSLLAALAQLEADGTDSDGDGVGDLDELRAGTDPNGTEAPPEEPVLYGFGCAQAPAEGSLALLAVALALRRWRRAPCPRR